MNEGQARSNLLEMGRKAGVGLHIASLPGEYGIGDIADSAYSFIDNLCEMGIGVWQFLPTGPTAYGDSPYQPLSAFAGNAMLLGMKPLVRLGLLSASDLDVLRQLPRDHVDYGRLIPAKNALLSRVAEQIGTQLGNGLRASYEEFLHRHDKNWLDDYAMFRILKTLHGERAWPEWEKPFVYRESTAMRAFADQHRAALDRKKVIQFLFDYQWRNLRQYANERGICLFGDMPIYIALDSADAWAHPEMLWIDKDGRPSHIAGVPPDYFSEDGQLWGNPIYDWDYHARTGYRWWIDRMRHAGKQTDLVRVDHFRGFESFWSVPYGAETARKGEWEPGPRDVLFDAMRKALGDLPIVAEDLGVITPEVDSLRLRHSIPGMVVLQFDISEPDFEMDDIEENCVCYTGTHDNDTTLGWFHGSKDDIRSRKEIIQTRASALKLTGGSAQTIHTDMIRLAFSSKAALAVAPMQDYLGLGSEARLNIPGTTLNNWRWRLQSGQLQGAFMQSVRELVDKSSRR